LKVIVNLLSYSCFPYLLMAFYLFCTLSITADSSGHSQNINKFEIISKAPYPKHGFPRYPSPPQSEFWDFLIYRQTGWKKLARSSQELSCNCPREKIAKLSFFGDGTVCFCPSENHLLFFSLSVMLAKKRTLTGENFFILCLPCTFSKFSSSLLY